MIANVTGLNNKRICKSQIRHDQVSGGVSAAVGMPRPLKMLLWNPLVIQEKVKFGNKVMF